MRLRRSNSWHFQVQSWKYTFIRLWPAMQWMPSMTAWEAPGNRSCIVLEFAPCPFFVIGVRRQLCGHLKPSSQLQCSLQQPDCASWCLSHRKLQSDLHLQISLLIELAWDWRMWVLKPYKEACTWHSCYWKLWRCVWVCVVLNEDLTRRIGACALLILAAVLNIILDSRPSSIVP